VKSLFKADLDFAADARARHVSDAFAERFLADGKMFPDSRPIVVGPDAVREALKGSKAEWYWAPVEGRANGDVGVTWGYAFLVVRGEAGREDQTYRGRYVTVWTRAENGEWKIWIDLGTQASPEE
jgi:ketosteroid isomerase-like protein